MSEFAKPSKPVTRARARATRLGSAGLAIVFLALSLACESPVFVGAPDGVSLSDLKSWSWRPHTVSFDTWRAGDPELENEIQRVVQQELEARGYPKVAASEADFFVTVYAEISSEIEVGTESRQSALYSNTGTTPSYEIGSEAELVRVYETGHILIDVTDPHGRVLWRGATMRRVRGNFDDEAAGLLVAIVREFDEVR
jgi:hypothetical protein